MSKPNEFWIEKYKIPSFLINLRGRAGLYSVLCMIQDAGWLHAANLGLKLKGQQSWVLTRQIMKMSAWPKWNEEVLIKTWVRNQPSTRFTNRDYELFVGENKIGEATSTFALFDVQLRKIIELGQSEFSNLPLSDRSLELQPKKIEIVKDVKTLATFEVRNSDIDSNDHVNNTRYAQWILDSLPIETLKEQHDLKSYEVNFLNETKIGDTVQIQAATNEGQKGENRVIQFQGVRLKDQKLAFVAELTLDEKN